MQEEEAMRNVFAVGIVAIAALVAVPVVAADYPDYPTYPTLNIPDLPQVDTGLAGGFYLRGSVGGNVWHAVDALYCNCATTTFSSPGYGYSLGVGFGYESGSGLRGDVTFDYLSNDGLTAVGGYKVNLRSGLVLANIYHDFSFHEGAAGGGLGAYVGLGMGFAHNYSEVYQAGALHAWGSSVEAAGAAMIGVSYDMGSAVADLGWRGIYMNKVMSQPPAFANAYLINNNFINEVRASIRYRFN